MLIPKVSKGKEIIISQFKINEIETRKIIDNINIDEYAVHNCSPSPPNNETEVFPQVQAQTELCRKMLYAKNS